MHQQYHPDEVDGASDYRAISPWSVVALLLGLASPLALLHPLLWIVPGLAIPCGLVALRQIARYEPTYTGRTLARCGLGVAIVVAVAIPTQRSIAYLGLRASGEQFALAWFDLLRRDEVLLAHQLTMVPEMRRPQQETLLEAYRDDSNRAGGLKKFVNDPDIRPLLALGQRATYRLYETESVAEGGSGAAVSQTFAVSYLDDAGEMQTFFVRIILSRRRDSATGRHAWYVRIVDTGTRPRTLPQAV